MHPNSIEKNLLIPALGSGIDGLRTWTTASTSATSPLAAVGSLKNHPEPTISEKIQAVRKNSRGVQVAGTWFEPILTEGELTGVLEVQGKSIGAREIAQCLAPILVEPVSRSLAIFDWVAGAREIAPGISQWIGVYFRASWWLDEETTDLVLGPFLGAPTDHVRIPLDKGFCGLALSEERTVNVGDVREDPRHIACSLTTRSELVIPLADPEGNYVAELDIDSDTPRAFTAAVSGRFHDYAGTFCKVLESWRP